MSGIHTTFLTAEHDYTKSKTPWIIDVGSNVCDRLAHYLSGGGMQTFGRTIAQEEAHRKHVRFFIVSAILFVLWLALYLF